MLEGKERDSVKLHWRSCCREWERVICGCTVGKTLLMSLCVFSFCTSSFCPGGFLSQPSWVGRLGFPSLWNYPLLLFLPLSLLLFFFYWSVEISTVGLLRPCTGRGTVPHQDEGWRRCFCQPSRSMPCSRTLSPLQWRGTKVFHSHFSPMTWDSSQQPPLGPHWSYYHSYDLIFVLNAPLKILKSLLLTCTWHVC